jgi:hypothetical protein
MLNSILRWKPQIMIESKDIVTQPQANIQMTYLQIIQKEKCT